MDAWSREWIEGQLDAGRLAYSELTGWQIAHEIAGELEWFSLTPEHAERVEAVARTSRAA